MPLRVTLLLATGIAVAACTSNEPVGSSAQLDGGAVPDVTDGDVPFDRDVAPDAFADSFVADAVPEAEPASPARLRIVVFADLNGSYGSTDYGSPVHAAVDAVVTRIRPDLVLLAGDLVAGQKDGLDYEAMWLGFHEAVTDPLVAAGIPAAVTPGNHDASAYGGFEVERALFVSQWTQPQYVPDVQFVDDTHYPLRYSFVHRGAFFLSLDATTVGPLSSEQRAWVSAQLAADSHPVKIVVGHVPIHPVTEGVATQVLRDEELESNMAAHGVTLFVSGHHHAYYPGISGGVRQVAAGCLGAGPRALIGSSETQPRSLLVIDVNDGAVESLEAFAGDDFGEVIDRVTLPEQVAWEQHLLERDDLASEW